MRMKFRVTRTLPAQVQAAFHKQQRRLTRWLPRADIQHIGSTAIPGTITKGDLDIVVRVKRTDFAPAAGLLARHYARNTASHRSRSFASFKDDHSRPSLGIQLVVCGSATDHFVAFRDRLRADAKLVRRYNALKRRAVGLSMTEYRRRKSAFIERILTRRGRK